MDFWIFNYYNDTEEILLKFLCNKSQCCESLCSNCCYSPVDFDWMTFTSLLGKADVNAIGLRTDRTVPGRDGIAAGVTFGSGLYLAGSWFDHACAPPQHNATVVFHGKSVKVVITAPQVSDVDGQLSQVKKQIG